MSRLGLFVRKQGMEVLMHSYLRNFVLDYPMMFTPQQLFCLCDMARRAAPLGGCFYEIGVAWANTTIFLNRYLEGEGFRVDYRVLDTFAGFTREDVAHEVEERGTPARIRHSFTMNDRRWIETKLARNGLGRIPCHAQDASRFDFAAGPPIAFALLDVDLYRPTAAILPALWDRLLPGGIIVVDDCDKTHELWNGAYQALSEFTAARGFETETRAGKLGILSKDTAGAGAPAIDR